MYKKFLFTMAFGFIFTFVDAHGGNESFFTFTTENGKLHLKVKVNQADILQEIISSGACGNAITDIGICASKYIEKHIALYINNSKIKSNIDYEGYTTFKNDILLEFQTDILVNDITSIEFYNDCFERFIRKDHKLQHIYENYCSFILPSKSIIYKLNKNRKSIKLNL